MNVIADDVAPLDADMSYLKHPVKVLGQQDQVMRRQMIQFFMFKRAVTLSKRLRGRPENSFILSI
jgi:hypothetical protein